MASKSSTLSSGLIRAQALLVVYLLSSHQAHDASLVLSQAIAGAQAQGYHLAPTGQPILW